jgi:hypothetical protein
MSERHRLNKVIQRGTPAAGEMPDSDFRSVAGEMAEIPGFPAPPAAGGTAMSDRRSLPPELASDLSLAETLMELGSALYAAATSLSSPSPGASCPNCLSSTTVRSATRSSTGSQRRWPRPTAATTTVIGSISPIPRREAAHE